MNQKTQFPEVQSFEEFVASVEFNTTEGALADVYPPEMDDLYSLYLGVRKSAAVAIIEIGSGWSTLALTMALEENRLAFGDRYVGKVRHPNAFELLTIDASEAFQDIAVRRLRGKWHVRKVPTGKIPITQGSEEQIVLWEVGGGEPSTGQVRGVTVNHLVSTPSMTTFSGQACHVFDFTPPFTADFVYLDGPDCNQVKGNIHGFSVNFGSVDHPYGLPMSADILIWEPYLWTGTTLVTDGRGANAQFLRRNLKRDWAYSFDRELDQHWFVLEDEPWGEIAAQHLALKSEFGAIFKP